MRRPVLLDLFCGAGGCAAGYARAGFEVVGVDHVAQPRYLLSGASAFVQADALMFLRNLMESEAIMSGQGYGASDGEGASGSLGYLLGDFDAIHASPPCQGYSAMNRAVGSEAPRLIPEVRRRLLAAGKLFVIENVEGADLVSPLLLCGTMFGLRVRRHRLFEIHPPLLILTPDCQCRLGVVSGRLVGQVLSGKVAPGRTPRFGYTESERRAAIGVPWMTTMEARQAIPPAYTEFIGLQLRNALEEPT